MSIPFNPLIQALPASVPFTGPETLERQRGSTFEARIGANESAFGISSLATQALHEAIGIEGCSWYGDPENFDLRQKLAKQHGVQMDNICVDAGIDSLLGLAVRTMVEPGTPVVTSKGAYPTFNYHVNGFGGQLKTVPYKDHHEDPEALLASAIEHNAKLIYLANPDNPMGTALAASRVQSLVEQLPKGCLLLLDEAYCDFMTLHDLVPLDMQNKQLVRFRTFSKAYGMAGMRIGYVLAHTDIIQGFNKVRNHFGVSRLAQIAACASLDDKDFMHDVLRQVTQGRERIYELAASLGLPYLASSTNFVTIDMGSSEKAASLISELNDARVFLRKPMVTPQDQFLRVGVGSDREHEIFAEVFRRLLNTG